MLFDICKMNNNILPLKLISLIGYCVEGNKKSTDSLIKCGGISLLLTQLDLKNNKQISKYKI